MKIALILVAMNLAFVSNAFANVTFTDLTAKRFNGNDSDLTGFGLERIGVNCSDSTVYSGGEPIISWKITNLRRNSAGESESLKKYKIHFTIKDRKGSVVHQESFEYLDNEPGGFSKKKYVNHEYDRCDKDYVWFNKKVNLTHSTIEYWVDNIVWVAFRAQEDQPDKVAFTIADQAKEFKQERDKRLKDEKSLVVKFMRPSENLMQFDLRPGLTGFLLDKGRYTEKIKTDNSWNEAIVSLCSKAENCDASDPRELISNGENIKNSELEDYCSKSGCVAFFKTPISEVKKTSACHLIEKNTKIELCRGGSGIFSSEICEKTTVRCRQVEPNSHGRQIQPGSEELFILAWPLFGKPDRVKVTVQNKTKTISLNH